MKPPALSGCLECLALEVGNGASGTKLGSFTAVDSLAPYNNFSSPATKSWESSNWIYTWNIQISVATWATVWKISGTQSKF
jgi:hypothetical protein